MEIQFLGSGDAFGSGGRFNTCILVRAQTTSFLIDCGATSLVAIRKFAVDPNAISTILISHLHGDHYGGLPFFILDGQFYSRRSKPLTIVGPPGLGERLKQVMELLMHGSTSVTQKFALDIVEIAALVPTKINGLTVTAHVVEHACGAPPYALRVEVDGKVLTYTGDTEWTESLVEAGRNADLLIAESLTFERRIRFHMDYASLKSRLGRIGAKRVVLTHLGPDMLARRGDVGEEIAEDGMTLTL